MRDFKFAEEGQIWGNPVYDWDAMEADEYRWWKRRVKLGNEARMNFPSTVGNNWRWRMLADQLEDGRRAWIRNLAAVYRR